jgi:hypothetical protein
MAREIQFVPVQTAHGHDKNVARKFVRSAAMRRFRRQQRVERAEEFRKKRGRPVAEKIPQDVKTIVPSVLNSTKDALTSHRQVSQPFDCYDAAWHSPDVPTVQDEPKCRQDQLCISMFPFVDLDLEAFDPIISCFPRSNKIHRVLLNHCKPILLSHFIPQTIWHWSFESNLLTPHIIVVHVIAPALQPLGVNRHQNPIITSWVPQALIEPAVLLATLFHSAVHLDGLHQRQWTSITLQYRGCAIRVTNDALRSPICPSSDANIAAVSMIAASGV